MLEGIAGAHEEVLLESYLFAVDEVGLRFVRALAERAREGIRVRLVVDAVGSWLLFPVKIERRLVEAGVSVRRSHRWEWRRPWRFNHRNHRKLPPQPAGAASMLLSNHTSHCRQRLDCLFTALFDDTRRALALTTPYFIPSRHMRIALCHAAQRGVDVRLLVPRVSDVRLARWAACAVYDELLLAGVRVYEYLPGMLHAKTVVADESWALVGTANLDYRSLFLNDELVLASRDPRLCRALWDQFEADIIEATEMTSEHWHRRRWILRIGEWLAWSLRRWL
jgi:cardiolipin synthase